MRTVGKHTDFTRLVMRGIPGFEGISVPVVDARAQICYLCVDPGTCDDPINQAAEYTVHATAVLSEAGVDYHYCQRHLRALVNSTLDRWAVRM